MKPTWTQLDQQLQEEIIAFRRALHQYPELSGEEFETSRKVQHKLEEYGIPFQAGYAKTGILGIIEGAQPGPTVAVRADMDALPIQEQNEHDFVSEVEGKMHACGHDAHTAMLLGVGKLLNEVQNDLPGRVLLVFQPAEEAVPTGGAQPMMEDGVFAEYEPDVIYGQHVWPGLPVGQIGVRAGEMMGASDRFKIEIKGSGGHASMPHQTVDAIVVANAVMNNLQTIVSRNVNPVDGAVLTIGKMEGGYRYNVIADRVTLEGTIRTFRPETREKVHQQLHSIVEGVAESMGARAEIDLIHGYPATINDSRAVERIRQTSHHLWGEDSTPKVEPVLGGEDFGRFLQKYPGAFIWLGTQLANEDEQKPLHDPQFQLNEKALPFGVQTMAQIVVDTLYDWENQDR